MVVCSFFTKIQNIRVITARGTLSFFNIVNPFSRSSNTKPYNKRYFSSNLMWERNLENAFHKAEMTKKPVMMVVHRATCGACQELKSKFNISKEIEKLSPKFVLISLVDDREVIEPRYSPDGNYTPRILFFHPSGLVFVDITNRYQDVEYKYFYSEVETIVQNMEIVLAIVDKKK